ncbi:hypothetical protein [Micromonospora echinofusca]|uniref:BFN domain-containing protein n=1 Tax=Micromonospora echinofusca TaxID=47858 RepID=A0ABS3VV56_MICEH|nr:hypothetical protein [Micromonospora echinofusca]MBO4208396.1 hypothetical protein [Micromonospora echinofusca]
MSLSVTVYLVDSPDAVDVWRAGAAHPVLGGLIDLGTAAPLVVPGSTTVRREVTDCCAELGAAVELVEVTGPLPSSLRDELETGSGKAPVFVVVLLAATDALVVACGPDLPSMGMLPPADPALLRASLRTALGDVQDESMFTEPHVDADAEEERRLSERLRQLYGE